MTVLAALLGAALPLGLILIVAGSMRRVRDTAPRPSGTQSRIVETLRPHFTRQDAIVAAVATALGATLAVFTGWIIAIFALPAVAVLMPKAVVYKATSTRIDKLEALETWTRSMAGVLGSGQGLRQAIASSYRSAPDPIRDEVGMLVARINTGRPMPEALMAFAQDIDDPVGDQIAATLILGSRETGNGLKRVLDGLASSTAADVRQRRQTQASRAGTRTQATVVSIFVPLVFAMFVFLTPNGKQFSDTLGQIVLGILAILFGGAMWLIRMIVTEKPEPRFLTTEGTTS